MITKCKYRFSLSFISANFINPSHSIKLKFWSKPSKFFLKFWSSVKIFSSDNLPNFYLTFDQLAKIYKFYRCKGLKTLADFNFSISLSCWLINAMKLIILELNFFNSFAKYLAFLFYSWLIPLLIVLCESKANRARIWVEKRRRKLDKLHWNMAAFDDPKYRCLCGSLHVSVREFHFRNTRNNHFTPFYKSIHNWSNMIWLIS